MSNRDYVMARLGAALAANLAQKEMISTALAIFADPQEDAKGIARKECVTDALIMSHETASGLNFALERLDTLGADELGEGEEEEDEEGGEEESDGGGEEEAGDEGSEEDDVGDEAA